MPMQTLKGNEIPQILQINISHQRSVLVIPLTSINAKFLYSLYVY